MTLTMLRSQIRLVVRSLGVLLIAVLALWAGAADAGAASGPSRVVPSGARYDEATVLVGFQRGTTARERGQVERDAQAAEVRVIGAGTHVLRVARGTVASKIAKLNRDSAVRFAEPNYIVHADAIPSDPRFGELWGLQNTGQAINGYSGTAAADIGATAAWDVSTGGRSSVVGIVDTGIDYNHPDLAANVWSAPTSFNVTIGGRTITCAAGSHGFNAITNTCDPMDDHYHGTHVAGTIGAVGNNGIGVTGVNWVASMMGAKFLDASGSGTTSNAINAIEFTIQAKARFGAQANVRVLNNSWGGGGYSQALLDEINRADASDMLFVAAAGNNRSNNNRTPFYPASYSAPNDVAVAATDNSDSLASFSNFGSRSVHLGAPGVDILSTQPGGQYGYLSGTSMATPHVSGAAALVLSNCALNTADLKSRLLNSTDPIPALARITVTGGRLNVNKALRACAALTAPAAPTGLGAAAGNAQVSLSWTGSAGATSYNVKRSTSAGGPYTTVATGVTTTSYTNTGLVNGTTYYYVVSAVNPLESPNSNQASAMPTAPPAPPPPPPRCLNGDGDC